MRTMQAEPARHPVQANESALRDWVRALEATAPIAAKPQRLLYHAVAEYAQTRPDAPALIAAAGGETLSYGTLVARADRYARWARDQGLAKGETVCLIMPNRPEYIAIWLGLSSAGIVVALINTELRGHSLAHCIDIVTPKHVIVAAECAVQLASATAQLISQPTVWMHGENDGGYARIDHAIERYQDEPAASGEYTPVTINDRALLIYTSGTTGLPKAANVSHRRLLQWSFWFAGLMNTTPHDRIYDCLPLYHSVGGVVATGALLVRGGSVLIRDRFSVRHFWDDVFTGNCTIFQYIGELCRYLVNAPEHPNDRAHRVRVCCGNGLQADIWKKFQDRFTLPRILEFYASTEGNVSL
jgi:fatty-acyl-CoA synthase